MLSISTNFINSLIGIKKQTEQLTEAELRQMIKIASNEGVIEKEQNVLHEKIFYFADKKAKHLMTHRTDVEWINIVKPTSEIKELLLKCQHSRIVCCKGSLDNFKGILNLKDFFKTLALNEKPRVEDIIYRPLILSESTDAQKVLTLLRKNKTHICCVVNEFGGFEGLITLHDIIENIVGQIPDEGEIYEPDVFIRADKSVLVSGDAPIETLSEIMHGFTVDFEKINYSTVAGFVLDQIGNIPQIGDTFDYTDYQIEIIDIDKNKIDKVLITKISDTHQ
jgi:putative hemolysin